jgi:outer membrane protein OmpA-like peptidoglycan-associated protein
MKTLTAAVTAIAAGAALLALTFTPAAVAFATTSASVPSTHVTSEAPISAGPSRGECLTPDFDDTGLAALQAAVTSFDTLTSSTVTCISAYLDSATAWADWESPWITDSAYGYTSWVAEEPQTRQLVLAVNLIPNSLEDASDPLSWEQSCANGDFNAYAAELGTNLVAAGLQNSVLRLGAEMNGTFEADFMGTTSQEQSLWATCFANEVTALRQAAGENFLIDWDPNASKSAYPYSNFYPGNSYVNIVGLDLYDVDYNTPSTAVTFSQLANEPSGLAEFEAFAAARGKPMSFPEWGLVTTPSGDDPGYIDGMASTIANGDFAFETYYDVGDGSSLALGSATPLSLAAYQEWFGVPSPTGGTISGTVTAAGGGDLAGMCAEAFLNGTEIAASTPTASDGAYTISGLAPGSYGVTFTPGCGGGDFATQWYNGEASGTQSAPGTLVAVTAASPVTGINATMSTGTSISGTVSAQAGGADLAGICVNAFSVGGANSAGTAATSAADGTFTIEGLLPGNYGVEFSAGSCGGSYVTQWYNDTLTGAPSQSGALAVSTSGVPATTNINAAMSPSTSISGTVSAAVSGAEIANMCVWAYPVGGGAPVKATTAVDGMYLISGIAAGSYVVEFYTYPCGGRSYVAQWYNDTPTGAPSQSGAMAIAATVMSPATDINAELTLGASISGTVTAVVGGSEVAGVCVSVTSAGGGIGGSAITAADGAYTVLGLSAGSYEVVADPTCGGTVVTSYASPQPTSGVFVVVAGGASTYNVGIVLPGSIVDVITPRTNAPTNAVVGGATYSPSAIATSGDNVQIAIDVASTGCTLSAGVVSFTAVGTCIIDFSDPSSGASDAYTSAVQVQQSFSVAASSGGGVVGSSSGSGSGGGGATFSPPPTSPLPTSPPAGGTTVPAVTPPNPREVTYAAGASALNARADEVLRALAKKLQNGAVVIITGYARHDAALAKKRADVVAAYLEKAVGVHVLIKVVTTSTVNKVVVDTAKV